MGFFDLTYVMLMTFFLKGGVILTRTTTTESLFDCNMYSTLIVKDEMVRNPSWHVQWIDVKCIQVTKGKLT